MLIIMATVSRRSRGSRALLHYTTGSFDVAGYNGATLVELALPLRYKPSIACQPKSLRAAISPPLAECDVPGWRRQAIPPFGTRRRNNVATTPVALAQPQYEMLSLETRGPAGLYTHAAKKVLRISISNGCKVRTTRNSHRISVKCKLVISSAQPSLQSFF